MAATYSPSPEIAKLAELGRKTIYRKGQVMLRPGDEPSDIFLIVEGIVKIYAINNLGEEYIHILFGPGEMFPLAWVVNSTPVSLYFAATSDCTVQRIAQEHFTKALDSNPQTGKEILAQAMRQFSVYVARVDNLEYKYARERLAYRILLIAQRFGKKNGENVELPFLGQQELGASINLSRESVSRELNRFLKMGLIVYEKGCLMVLDAQGLRKEIGNTSHSLFLDNL